jgi:molecular chaperone Hsp33
MTGDILQRFVFEHAPIRGEIVHLDATWRAVLERRHYPTAVRDILGELMAAAALLTATLKFNGKLTMQVQGGGPVKLLVVECTSDRAMRALAQWDDEIEPRSLPDLLGHGQLIMTIDPTEGKERYQGIVGLEGDTVTEVLEHYFRCSEQLETRLWLAVNNSQAAGMLLQQLPHTENDDPDVWARAVQLGSTLTHQELLALPVRDLLHRLYHEEDIRLFSRRPVSFRCSCSRGRVARVLRMLGHNEVRDILAERGAIDVDCEFCGSRYEFDCVDAEQLFATVVAAPVTTTRH